MTLTLAMPKQGKLLKPFADALERAQFTYNQDTGLITDKTNIVPDIAAMVLRDMDALADLSDGTVDIAPVGLNAYEEFNCASGYAAPMAFERTIDDSKCTLTLAGTIEDNITSLESTKGRTIITTYPEILKSELDKIGIMSLTVPQWQTASDAIQDADIDKNDIATIIVRKGGIEEKAAELNALVFDLVQTGNSLIEAGFDLESSLPILESMIVIAQPKTSNLGPLDQETLDMFMDRIAPQELVQCVNENQQNWGDNFAPLETFGVPVYAT